MDFYEKLTIEKAKRKLNNKALGKVIDMEGEAFRMAVTRKSLSALQIREIEKFFDSHNLENKQIENSHVLNEPAPEYQKGVPYYDVEFSAGFLEVENNQSAHPDSYISHPFFKGCDYVVRASGQSMAKVICHGDAIGLRKVNNWQEFFPFGSNRLFSNRGLKKELDFVPGPKRITRDTATTLWRKLIKKDLGITANMYSLKHLGANKKILAGVELDALRELYGHTSKMMTLRYAKVVKEINRKQILEKSPDF